METLKNQLNSSEENKRIYAVQDIIETQNSAFSQALIQQLGQETSPVVKDGILLGLMKLDCKEYFSELFKLFSHQDAFVRNAAVTVFGSKKADAIAFLTANLDHADREVRKLVLDALYATQTNEARMAIRAGLNDSSVNVKITAVEYLGQLSDKESIPEMLMILESEHEPMLISSILDSLSGIGTEKDLQKVINILCKNSDVNTINQVYMPEIMRLISKVAGQDFICRILSTISDPVSYAEDILGCIGHARKRFDKLTQVQQIFDLIAYIAREKQLSKDIRYAACELLISGNQDDKKRMETLGSELITEETMKYAGVRFLAKAESKSAYQTIETIYSTTKDPHLKDLCNELLNA